MSRPNFYNHVNVYEFSCTLPGSKKTVPFKPVSTGQIKKLLTYENETNYVVQEQALDDLISSSVLSEGPDGFDVKDLYIYDRLYLLMEIRKKTKGEVLEFQITCPECNSQSLNRVNLDELQVKQLNPKLDLSVKLSSGIKVFLRHMTRRHQVEDIKPNLFTKGMSERQMSYMFQVAFHACAIEKIETPSGIDEDIPMKDRMYFIEQIPMLEMDKIREKLDEVSFGIILEHKTKCNHCKYEHIYDIPIQQNFFS